MYFRLSELGVVKFFRHGLSGSVTHIWTQKNNNKKSSLEISLLLSQIKCLTEKGNSILSLIRLYLDSHYKTNADLH